MYFDYTNNIEFTPIVSTSDSLVSVSFKNNFVSDRTQYKISRPSSQSVVLSYNSILPRLIRSFFIHINRSALFCILGSVYRPERPRAIHPAISSIPLFLCSRTRHLEVPQLVLFCLCCALHLSEDRTHITGPYASWQTVLYCFSGRQRQIQ